MRKLILSAAVSPLATQAYADGSRSLSLAATTATEPATAQPQWDLLVSGQRRTPRNVVVAKQENRE